MATDEAKKTDETEQKPDERPKAEKDTVTPVTPTIDPEQFAEMVKSVAGMVSEITSLKESVTALANQGSVGQSVALDNSQKEPEYPTINLDEVNRLLGV